MTDRAVAAQLKADGWSLVEALILAIVGLADRGDRTTVVS